MTTIEEAHTTSILLDKIYRQRMFKYRRLDPTDNEIRLLRVWPAREHSALLRCSISHFPSAKAPVYHALSYTWGTEAATKQILLNGKAFFVRPNLEAALRQLRSKWRLFWIWADAICISQDNNEERSQQVMLMQTIFTNAVGIHAWLGVAASDSDRAMNFVRDWSRKANSQGLTPEFLEWRRVWVVQEVSNRKQVTVVCGSEKIDFQAFKILYTSFAQFSNEEACSFFSHLEEDRHHLLRVLVPAIIWPLSILTSIQLDQEGRFETLLLFNAVMSYRRCEATDPRDKIYAVLGLLGGRRQEDVLAFTPDYNISTQTLYKQFARYFLSRGEPYFVLERCGGGHQVQGLPSWAPDWTRADYSTPMSIFSKEEGPIADGNLFPAFEISPDGDRLLFKGMLVSRVQRLTSAWQPDDDVDFTDSIDQILLESLLLFLGLDSFEFPNQGNLTESITFLEDNYDHNMKEPYVGGGTKAIAWSRAVCGREVGFTKPFEDGDHSPNNSWPEQVLHPKSFMDMVTRICSLLRCRRVCVSVDGYIAVVPKETEKNDCICVLQGVPVPFIIRELKNGFTLMGGCYVQGLMEGEAVKKVEEGLLEVQTITLV